MSLIFLSLLQDIYKFQSRSLHILSFYHHHTVSIRSSNQPASLLSITSLSSVLDRPITHLTQSHQLYSTVLSSNQSRCQHSQDQRPSAPSPPSQRPELPSSQWSHIHSRALWLNWSPPRETGASISRALLRPLPCETYSFHLLESIS